MDVNPSESVVIVSACRTPIGSFLGSLAAVSAKELGRMVSVEALRRAQLPASSIDETFFGCVLTAGLGQNIARQISVAAGVPVIAPALTLNMVCGSGMRAVMLGIQAILSGDADAVLAGGVESMSQAAHVLPQARSGLRIGTRELRDSMLDDGLTDAFEQIHMGITAENIARRYQISRVEQDAFACRSQQRAEAAIQNSRFAAEIVPVSIEQRKGPAVLFSQDEFPRAGTTVEALARLRPAFEENGTVTAGNSSGINDGAAAVVLMRESRAQNLGLRALARIRASASAGVDPAVMGLGPIPSTKKALAKAGLAITDLHLVEANEAFAAQSIAVERELALDPDKLNVNGGAIALGHPIGASGARILVTLLAELERRGEALGLATLCIGGGMGTAIVVERV